MSEIIRSSVEVSRIEDHVRRTYRTAVARGSAIGAAAATRLKVPVGDVDVALAAHRSTTEAEAAAWATVQSEDAQSDVRIGGVRDAMWAALGRPGQSRYMSQVFPGGIGTYTKGDPRRQPVLMTLLESRIVACAAPQWSEDQRKAWAASIAEARKTYEAALTVHHAVEAAAFVASASYRSAVKMAHEALRAFKRDLQNLGLSRAQIFDIIPDGTPSAPAAPKASEAVVPTAASPAAATPEANLNPTPA